MRGKAEMGAHARRNVFARIITRAMMRLAPPGLGRGEFQMFTTIAMLPLFLTGVAIILGIAILVVLIAARIVWLLLPVVAMLVVGSIVVGSIVGEIYLPEHSRWQDWLMLNSVLLLFVFPALVVYLLARRRSRKSLLPNPNALVRDASGHIQWSDPSAHGGGKATTGPTIL